MGVDATIWTKGQFEQHAANSERVVAFGLMTLSLAGTYLGATGGVLEWRVDTFICSLLWQLAVSAFQFIHVGNWRSAWYLIPLLLSVAPTVFGYGFLLFPYTVTLLTGLGTPFPEGIAYVVLVLAAVGIDVLPERILVKRG